MALVFKQRVLEVNVGKDFHNLILLECKLQNKFDENMKEHEEFDFINYFLRKVEKKYIINRD